MARYGGRDGKKNPNEEPEPEGGGERGRGLTGRGQARICRYGLSAAVGQERAQEEAVLGEGFSAEAGSFVLF